MKMKKKNKGKKGDRGKKLGRLAKTAKAVQKIRRKMLSTGLDEGFKLKDFVIGDRDVKRYARKARKSMLDSDKYDKVVFTIMPPDCYIGSRASKSFLDMYSHLASLTAALERGDNISRKGVIKHLHKITKKLDNAMYELLRQFKKVRKEGFRPLQQGLK